ncbi:hypothetical protein CHS0354_030588 [Potamilus streckersoni]|uniref:peptide chain release factor N(5)-glutamine methyltransferase n=1 Tax=Potamilus streckersoni TaxID=2493646 RepID=A0AAE0SCP2_9BIVA|nr:hypothetical protein CHS0354_030588 [Potamilus streckersoni]
MRVYMLYRIFCPRQTHVRIYQRGKSESLLLACTYCQVYQLANISVRNKSHFACNAGSFIDKSQSQIKVYANKFCLTGKLLGNILPNRQCCQSINRRPSTVSEIIQAWVKVFQDANVAEPVESANLIVSYIMGHTMIHNVDPTTVLYDNQMKRVEEFCKQRLQRVPVQYILGEWDFHSLTLKMRPPVFIPRPETEELASHVEEDIIHQQVNGKLSPIHVLEIGCGSGAVSLHLVHSLNQVNVVAVDKSMEACSLTQENSEKLGVADRLQIFNLDIRSDGTIEVLKRFSPFDVIVSNPPYISTTDMANLAPEISRFEDPEALHGGETGLDVIIRIIDISSQLLKNNGSLWLEVDSTHPPLIQNYISQNPGCDLRYLETVKDFLIRDRFCQIVKTT